MNRDCHGNFFTFQRQKLYCCFMDSSVVAGAKNGGKCPQCERKIVAYSTTKPRVEIVTFVVLPKRGRIEIPKHFIPKKRRS